MKRFIRPSVNATPATDVQSGLHTLHEEFTKETLHQIVKVMQNGKFSEAMAAQGLLKGMRKGSSFDDTSLYRISVWLDLHKGDLSKYNNPFQLSKVIAKDYDAPISAIRSILERYPFDIPGNLKPTPHLKKKSEEPPVREVQIPVEVERLRDLRIANRILTNLSVIESYTDSEQARALRNDIENILKKEIEEINKRLSS